MERKRTSDRLKEIMDIRGLKQVDILRKAEPFCKEYNVKLQKSDLSQYVSGTVEPGQEKLAILGMALNVSEAWLLGYDVPMEKHLKSDSQTIIEGINNDYSSESMQLISFHFNRLNKIGQKEALKRLMELTMIKKYTKGLQEELEAAHSIEGATQEDKDHDDDIMNNF